MNKRKYGIHFLDARNIASISSKPIVDVTITSPPYFDMKDYGYPEQIGYGQKYEGYLSDLKKVFSGVYSLTKETGSLWVIIDTFRRNGAVIPLPFDFANTISTIGWKLQEIIIWEKDKTVPWIHLGQMRNLFEYILVFSKSEKYNFHIDRIRQCDCLKKWWVKYPERYNPKGKAPEAIWRFPIPVQGSWGQNYVRHFCPLPEDLIAQIITLTTEENDVVLDPFAGSGAVLVQASSMQRKYIGAELNKEYIDMFEDYLEKTQNNKRKRYFQSKKLFQTQDSFSKTIIELRSLKYARVLFKRIEKQLQKCILHIFVHRPVLLENDNSVAQVKYCFVVKDSNKISILKDNILCVIKNPPLSKYGIDPLFDFNIPIEVPSGDLLFGYSKTATHKFQEKIDDLSSATSLIISPIKVCFNEEYFE